MSTDQTPPAPSRGPARTIARRTLLAAAAAGLAARPAFAIDPGVASGRYEDDEAAFDLKHAIALAIDNAEGHNEGVKYRVVLSDVEVPASALCGISFPPVWALAMSGAINGLMLQFDPATPTNMTATILTKPEPGYSLGTTTFSDTSGLWTRLDAGATRISGELKPLSEGRLRATFSAPVFTNPVVADLRGAAVQTAEPVKVLIARAEALQRGDFATVKALSTATAAEGFDKLDPKFLTAIRRQIPVLIRQLKTAPRVVVRRETAAVLFDKSSYSTAVLVDGVWKGTD